MSPTATAIVMCLALIVLLVGQWVFALLTYRTNQHLIESNRELTGNLVNQKSVAAAWEAYNRNSTVPPDPHRPRERRLDPEMTEETLG